MTYRRAWALVDTLNRDFPKFGRGNVQWRKGGGGARLTPLGEELVARYLALEAKVNPAAEAELAALAELAD